MSAYERMLFKCDKIVDGVEQLREQSLSIKRESRLLIEGMYFSAGLVAITWVAAVIIGTLLAIR